MKKLFSLLLVLALALVPTLSLADDDAACQNLYNMLLDELKSVDLEMTADEESYCIYLGTRWATRMLSLTRTAMPSPSTSATPIRLMRRLCRR
mgnify:CR=1 FL=1